jgi:phosphoglycolate phosphatase-like HAD superfamily hydrolase
MDDERPVVAFDCDGVLLDSNVLKVRLFRETVADAGFAEADIERFSAYQSANFGTSRYRLFETLLGWDLSVRPPVSDADLVQRYAELLAREYPRVPATPAMREIVAALGTSHRLFVVSGSDEGELRHVLATRGDASYFAEILGSPTTKAEHLARIRAAWPDAPLAFVGDAEADFRAARAVDVPFVYMDAFSTVAPRMRELAVEFGFPVIDDLRALPDALTTLLERC